MSGSNWVFSTGTGRVCPKCSRPQSKCVCRKGKPQPGQNGQSDGIIRIKKQTKGRNSFMQPAPYKKESKINPSKCKRFFSSLVAGGSFLVGLSLIMNGAPQIACANPGELFVTPAGSGDCSQGNPCDLQTALGTATDGDTVYLTQGTYTGTGKAVITVTRNITFHGGWDGTTTTPVVRDSDAYPTTLDGQDSRHVIYISGDNAPFIDGFIITGGKAEDGGGICIQDASPIIQNNVITANRTIDSGTYDDGRGGGIYIDGSSTAVIAQNHILDNTSGYGGGIYHYSSKTVTITSNEIAGNIVSFRGGGILVERAPDVIQSNVISDNSATGDGGGMLVWAAAPQIKANRIMNNSAHEGGGISLGNNATPNLTNNLLISNTRDGLLVGDSSPAVINNTIVGSGLPNAGGGILLSSSAGCSPPYCTTGAYTNNIVISYEAGIYGIGPVTPLIDYNDVWGNTTADYILPAGVATGTHNNNSDPLFVGSSDYHLTASSPCIDSGNNDAPNLPATDKDGNPRIVNGTVDMGAYEFHPIVYIAPDDLCDGHAPCYPKIQDGIDWEGIEFTIKAEQGTYGEDIIFYEPKEITFQAGWDSVFENASMVTMVDSMSISSGKVILDKGSLAIQPETEGK